VSGTFDITGFHPEKPVTCRNFIANRRPRQAFFRDCFLGGPENRVSGRHCLPPEPPVMNIWMIVVEEGSRAGRKFWKKYFGQQAKPGSRLISPLMQIRYPFPAIDFRTVH
jgi:hypothetical protein